MELLPIEGLDLRKLAETATQLQALEDIWRSFQFDPVSVGTYVLITADFIQYFSTRKEARIASESVPQGVFLHSQDPGSDHCND